MSVSLLLCLFGLLTLRLLWKILGYFSPWSSRISQYASMVFFFFNINFISSHYKGERTFFVCVGFFVCVCPFRVTSLAVFCLFVCFFPTQRAVHLMASPQRILILWLWKVSLFFSLIIFLSSISVFLFSGLPIGCNVALIF